jgi:hypothetical protein
MPRPLPTPRSGAKRRQLSVDRVHMIAYRDFEDGCAAVAAAAAAWRTRAGGTSAFMCEESRRGERGASTARVGACYHDAGAELRYVPCGRPGGSLLPESSYLVLRAVVPADPLRIAPVAPTVASSAGDVHAPGLGGGENMSTCPGTVQLCEGSAGTRQVVEDFSTSSHSYAAALSCFCDEGIAPDLVDDAVVPAAASFECGSRSAARHTARPGARGPSAEPAAQLGDAERASPPSLILEAHAVYSHVYGVPALYLAAAGTGARRGSACAGALAGWEQHRHTVASSERHSQGA